VGGERTGSASQVTQREFAIGQRLFGRYTLIKILGRGGMGIVWLAHDEELERDVALKFLPDLLIHDAAVLSNLKHETRRCLELTHKNIVRIHDFVHDERSGCLSMEYVDGDTLSSLRCDKERKVFETAELSDWLSQLCDALDYAHNYAHIIHRDLKPANLMVNQRGELKVSDFGIARSLTDSVSRLTAEEGRSGTLVYMSPQQLNGERSTHLDDIYSLGASIYELLTSKPPFYTGNIDRQICERVAPSMTERRKELDIEPASLPQVWEDAVAACLAKDPSRRPQSAAEVAQRLRLAPGPARITRIPGKGLNRKVLLVGGIAALCALAFAGVYFGVLIRQAKPVSRTAPIPEKSIAVLPFENRSEDKSNAYFADGVQDEILTRLSKIADLKVISRTSTQHYKSAPENLSEIAKQLAVAHILEGSVQKSGDAVRVNVQLIKAANDSHLWADSFDRKLTDIFSVESDIAKTIADTLQAKLTGAEKQMISGQPTSDLTAYDLYLKGRLLWSKRGGDNMRQAIAFYEQAIARDRNYALAYAALAETYVVLPVYTEASGPEAFAKAKAAALKALQLDDKLAEAHNALALVLFLYLDFAGSIAEFQRAIALNPNYATAHHWYGFNPLCTLGRFDEAIAESKRAVELDPLSPVINSDLGSNLMVARRYDEAIAQLRKTLEIYPTFSLAHGALAEALQFKGDLPGAIAEYTKAQELGADPSNRVRMAAAKAQSGDKDAAVRMLAELEEASRHREIPGVQRAVLYISLGNRTEAIRCLEQSVADHDSQDVAWIKVYPTWDPLRGDPRFEALVQKVVGPGHK
jgi:eukaryotic-like serine/threonine-protein kinase